MWCNLINISKNIPLNIGYGVKNVGFRSTNEYIPYQTPVRDDFVTNPIEENFTNLQKVQSEAVTNPHIREIMREYKLPVKINENELNKLHDGHLRDTRVIAAKIYSNLPPELKEGVNPKQLQDAAMLHDYGKILIPDRILNKKGELNDEEKAIMNLHSELGYELLKNKNLDENTLNLIKYHHQNPVGSGYPAVTNDYEHSIGAQILSAADEYMALREKRSYKDELSREEALAVIRKNVDNGEISPEIYSALVKSV